MLPYWMNTAEHKMLYNMTPDIGGILLKCKINPVISMLKTLP